MKLGGWLVMLTAMIMFLTFMGLPTGLNPILETLGININQETATLETIDIEGSGFWAQIFGSGTGVLLLAIGGGIVTIGLFALTRDKSFLLLPFILFVAGLFIATFGILISYVSTFEQSLFTTIITIIFASLAIGFTMETIIYFKGGG